MFSCTATVPRRGVAGLALGLSLLLAACSPTGASTTPTPTPKPTATPIPACTTWQIIPSPAAPLGEGLLTGVAALSPSEAWAVGYTLPPGGSQVTPLIEQWDGSAWRIVSSPGAGGLNGVAAVSSQDVWAVGGGPGGFLIEHWDGAHWSITPSPISSGGGTFTGLSSVVALSANEVWAVGSFEPGGPLPLTTVSLVALRWDGTAWRAVTAPAPAGDSWNAFSAAARIPGTSRLWAVGYTGVVALEGLDKPLIEQWDGSAWRIVPSPALPSGVRSGQLTSVTALSATDAWAVGRYFMQWGEWKTLIAHWDGSAWKVVSNPNSVVDRIGGLAAVSAADVRAVANTFTTENKDRSLIEQWNGSTWQTIEGPMPQGAWSAELDGIATDGAGGYWAVGSYRQSSSGNSQTLIARCS